ncbi:MAG: TonB-dependent receptor [Burkholderiaceae bacterium]
MIAARAGLAGVALAGATVSAQTTDGSAGEAATLPAVTVSGHQDALDEAPPPARGGQVGSGARLGILGNTPVLDAPFSVTSYTAETIQTLQARSVADVIAADPSVRMSSARSNINEDLTIRGFPVSSSDFALNGMYGLTPFWRAPLEAVERVEVLKGPTAMLMGMAPGGNIGGTVNLVSKRAGAEPLTRFTGSYLSDSVFGAHLDVGRRFGPANAFGVRMNLMQRQGDTVIDRQWTKERLASLGLDYRGQGWRVSADLLWQSQRIDNVVRQFQVAPTLTTIPRVPDNKIAYPGYGYSDSRDGSAVVKAEYDLNENLTAYAGYGQYRNNWDAVAGNPVMLDTAGNYSYFGGWQRQHVRSESAELGLRSEFRTGGIGHKLTLGYTLVDQKRQLGFYTGYPGGVNNLYSPTDPDSPSTAGIANPLRPMSDARLASVALADTLSMLDDRLLVSLGLRRQSIAAQNYSFSTGAADGERYDESAVTPMVGVVYKLQPNLSLYASHIQGLSRGDTAPITAGLANPGQMLAPYKSKQHEVGVKLDAAGLMTTVSLFQLTRPSASVSDNVFRVNGEQRNRGLEVATAGEIARGVRLLGGVTYTQAKLHESPTAALVGKDAIGVPRWLANIGAEWDAGFAPGLTFIGRVLHNGDAYLDAANTLVVPSWNRFDVGARYRTRLAGKDVTLRLYVENLTDKDYYGVATAGYLHLGTPRTLSLSASVDL